MTSQTTQLNVSEFFEGKEVRMINRNGEVWFPMVDLAEAWEINRKTLDSITNRNGEVFRGYTEVWEGTYPKQNQPDSKNLNNSLKYVNEQGLYVLMAKVIAGKVKNPDAKERLIRFQRRVPELLKSIHAGETLIVPTQQVTQPQPNLFQNAAEIIKEQLDIADLAIERCDIPKAIAQGYAWSLAEKRTGLELNAYADYIKKAKPVTLTLPEPGPLALATSVDKAEIDSYFSLSQIAEFVKKSYNTARDDLEALGIITRTKGRIHLTKYGELGGFGKLFWIMPMSPYDMTPRPHVRFTPEAKEALMDLYKIGVEQCQLK